MQVITVYRTLAIASLLEPHHAAICLDREDNHEPDSDWSSVVNERPRIAELTRSSPLDNGYQSRKVHTKARRHRAFHFLDKLPERVDGMSIRDGSDGS